MSEVDITIKESEIPLQLKPTSGELAANLETLPFASKIHSKKGEENSCKNCRSACEILESQSFSSANEAASSTQKVSSTNSEPTTLSSNAVQKASAETKYITPKQTPLKKLGMSGGCCRDDGIPDSSVNCGHNDGPSHYALSGGHQPKARICRDFIRGLCRRKYCRYPHVLSSDLVVFCHDFQNSFCPRTNCKFLHYSIEEEEHYRKYGEFPQMEEKDPQPQRFNRNEYQRFGGRLESDPLLSSAERLPPGPLPVPANVPQMGYRQGAGYNDCHYINPREYRSAVSGGPRDEFGNLKRPAGPADRGYGDDAFKRFREDNDRDPPDIMAIIRKFEEEQAMLRRRVEANEIKIAELRASNEYLMAQNAQLRLNTVQVSRVVSTVTNTTPQQAAQAVQAQPTQVINAVSMAPVQVATPIVSMATQQQPTLIASNGPQLAIATNTTQGQQLTLAQPNISTLSTSTQQLTPLNQITLTPTLAPAPSMGLAINTSQAIAISNATQPIISYPIMTHSILPH